MATPAHNPAELNPGDEMLTLEETCAFLRLPEGTLRYWRQIGAGPRSFKVGRHVRYWRTDLLLWLSEQTNNTPQPRDPGVSPQISRFDSRRSDQRGGR